MNVAMITMEPDLAQAKLNAYRNALAHKHSAAVEEEWSAAERAYRELAKGTPLIDPIQAIRDAGLRADDFRPKLAIARADRNSVLAQYSAHVMTWTFRALQKGESTWRDARSSSFIFKVPSLVAPDNVKSGRTMVPMVPPDVIPRGGCDLSKHFILWEVEEWKIAPPTDPILLKPIGGSLYAVVAQWDLTDLERTIIAGTRGE